jgi:hypothetical protein
LKASFSDAESSGAGFFVFKNQWSGDHLDFRASMLTEHDGDCGCRRGPRRQFLISQVDQIHKMDCISEMTSIGLFRHGCLHHEGI